LFRFGKFEKQEPKTKVNRKPAQCQNFFIHFAVFAPLREILLMNIQQV
jgi:hypothetical protein